MPKSVKNSVPNVVLRIPLDPADEVESETLIVRQLKVTIIFAQDCGMERTLQFCCIALTQQGCDPPRRKSASCETECCQLNER